MVDARDAEACLAALERLVTDDALRRRLQEQGVRDICRFYPERAAFNMLNALFGPEIDEANRVAAAREEEARREAEAEVMIRAASDGFGRREAAPPSAPIPGEGA